MPCTRTAPPCADALRAAAIEDLRGLEGLRDEWTQLWAGCPNASTFLSPHWLLPWWRHLGEGRLAAVTVRSVDDGALVALAPLYVYPHPQTRVRHLFPVGIGTTDHLDILLRPGWEAAALAAIVSHLAQRDDWDVLEFPQLRAQSPLLHASLPPQWRSETVQDEPSPRLSLRAARELPVPRAMAQNVRTARHRAERAGTLTHETADAQSLPELLDALARLHGQRWSQRGEAGVLADQAVLAFHREAAPALLAAGLLRLHALRLDGEVIAALYCLADPPSARERRHSYYIGGFDPGRRALSPGTLLVAHAIELAMADGACAFDFLRGAEPYKYRWGARDEPMFTLRASRRIRP